jgi:short-subunit dehydrogenase involved in D-alanine esterification of teichoic acids
LSRPITEAQIAKYWGIPKKAYWLQINCKHESQGILVTESSVVIQVRGLGAGPTATTKIHLKTKTANKIFEVNIREDAKRKDVETLAMDLLDDSDNGKLYRDGSVLSLEDGVKDWATATGGKTQIGVGANADLDYENEEVEIVKVMEASFGETSRWLRDTQ